MPRSKWKKPCNSAGKHCRCCRHVLEMGGGL